ncbi:MAG: 16S rRNA (guanine(527)-N(7))-methyltransferase RsmG [Proteobacteria bacterium]|nr:16S rRNA (guanine(527)-N(7))-methyltransferase RsmG [Pseudomonadota bacterium]
MINTSQTQTVLSKDLSVSRETLTSLLEYEKILSVWTKKINLISAGSVDNIWARHILDSAQIFLKIPKGVNTVADLGSGAGFPGMVLAILARELRPELNFKLVESDQRKAVFLREVSRILDVSVSVVDSRIEKLNALDVDIVTARALAPLVVLFGYAERHLRVGGIGIFLKGERFIPEIKEALLDWEFKIKKEESETNNNSFILTITELRRLNV